MTGFGTNGKKGTGAVKQIRVNTDSERRIKAQMAANSLAWHNAKTQTEKDALHEKNAALARQLGPDITYDAASGKWKGSAGGGQTAAPSYTSRYQPAIDETLDRMRTRSPFTYDPAEDPLYRQYETAYTRAGKRAMQDTLGEVSARTGGLASTWAESAAQQTYGNYMAGLAAEIPALRELAYEMYRDEGEDLRTELDLLTVLEDRDHARYQTELDQYNKDRDFAYSQRRDTASDLREREAQQYKQQQEQLEAEAEAEAQAYRRAQDKARTLAAAGDFTGYLALGYTSEEIDRMRRHYLESRR